MNESSIVPTLDLDPSPINPGQGLRVGLFDSGLGGLSVLRAMRAHLPDASLLYVADSLHAPYGERDDSFIAQRAIAISSFLLSQGAQAIVVACNTATAMAVHTLRERFPNLPIIGVEPGVKPAVASSINKRIGVLATPGTLASEKFKRLIAAHAQGAHIFAQACPGLAKEIEAGELDSPALRALVSAFAQPLIEAGVDTAVLGCTHYPFVRPLFQEALGPDVQIIDTADAVAKQTVRICESLQAADASIPMSTQLWTSGEPALLTTVAFHWLKLQVRAQALPRSEISH